MNFIVPMVMEVHKFPRISYTINLTKKMRHQVSKKHFQSVQCNWSETSGNFLF